jgi:endonuclease YncB( thermonuclease family)
LAVAIAADKRKFERLYELEAYARLRQLGLWADPKPVAPWEWREQKRSSAVGM